MSRLLFTSLSCLLLVAGAFSQKIGGISDKITAQTMPAKWSRLNRVAVLFEYAVDADGNTHSDYGEWK